MKLDIPLTPDEEARLSVEAKRNGLAPEEWIKRLALENLAEPPRHAEEEMDAKLRRWQEQTGTALLPDVPAPELFARWAEEDALMTEEEREAEDRLWEDIERGLTANKGLQLRRWNQ
jgi:hypothetical protein